MNTGEDVNAITTLLRRLFAFLLPVLLLFALAFPQADATGVLGPLSPGETKWLMDHPVIRYAPDILYPPVEYEADGSIQGIALDTLAWIEDRYPVTFQIVRYESWDEQIEAIKRHDIDLLTAAQTPSRMAFMRFSDPYIESPTVLIRRKNDASIRTEDRLLALLIGVNKGSAVSEYMRIRFPKAHTAELAGTVDGLYRLLNNQIDAVVAESFQASYYISDMKLAGLTIETEYLIDFPIKLSFGVRDDMPELADILNKILASMPASDKRQIETEWIGNPIVGGISRELFLAILAIVVILASVMAVVVVWNKSLTRTVHQRTQDLQNTNAVLQEKNRELQEKNSEILAKTEEIVALYQQMKALNDTLTSSLEQLQTSYRQTALSLANAIEANDKYTKGHCERVTRYSKLLGRACGLTDQALQALELSAQLHDIGKISIPWHILNKTSALDEVEYNIIKTHPQVGHDILKDCEYLLNVSEVILQHHERMDGRGYPHGLMGGAISLHARILTITDAFDAMTTNRPYRSHCMTHEEASREILRCAGTQFDPELAALFAGIVQSGDLQAGTT